MKRIRPGLSGLAGLTAVLLAACATEYEPQSPPARHVAAAPAEHGLALRASAFESYMRRARGIDPGFNRPSQVAQALSTGASHEPSDLEAGMVAYAALAALQDERFVAGVRALGAHGEIARRLTESPAYALELPGGDGAAALAAGALHAQGEALKTQGERVKHASYTVQHQSWSKRRPGDAGGWLARVKRVSSESYRPEAGDAAHLRTALAEAGRRGGWAGAPLVERGVALAALTALGEEGRGRSLMSEPRTASCLRLAKLNLYQCLASSGPPYEHIYCLGQHAMIDTGQCTIEAAQAPPRAGLTRVSYRR